jgi:peptide chain release factor 1
LSAEQSIIKQLEQIQVNFSQLLETMSDPEVISDNHTYQKLTRKHSELQVIVSTYEVYKQLKSELEEYTEILHSEDDPELLEYAKEGLADVKEQLPAKFTELQRLLLPRDPNDGKNVILEIRAGTGGDEATLFAAEMFRAYCRYSEKKRWKISIGSMNETGVGGLKEVTCVIEGRDVFSALKFESGTHRVQRVPQTETQGRVHTSAITVAVLPEQEEVDVQIDPGDLRIDRFRSSGAGGQHVNTTDSAIRITHLPSGLVVSCQDEKSQIKNKAKALKVLRARLYEHESRAQHDKIASERKTQIGSGDRSEKIRTYNFPQGRVTDHRIKFTLYRLNNFMQGEMDEMINACRSAFEAKRIQEQFEE